MPGKSRRKPNVPRRSSGSASSGNGRNHPPSHSVTAIDETAIIAEYSARKNNDQRKPLYSVWNPAVNSDSASGRSKGARLVSATMAMAKMTKRDQSERKEFEDEPDALRLLRLHNADHAERAGAIVAFRLVIKMTETTASPMATSYETICALDRSAPISG